MLVSKFSHLIHDVGDKLVLEANSGFRGKDGAMVDWRWYPSYLKLSSDIFTGLNACCHCIHSFSYLMAGFEAHDKSTSTLRD